MANDKNRQSIRVKGNGNVIGNNNVTNSRREEHHHYHGVSSKGRSSGDDAAGMGLGMLFAVLVICWVFVRHAAEVYFYIKLGALVSAIPFFGVMALVFFSTASANKQVAATCFGFILSGAIFLLAQYGQDSLDPRLLQFSQQARDAWAFWKGLTEYGRNVVVGSLMGAICLGTAVFFSFLMGIFVLWQYLSGADNDDNSILSILNPFRPSRGGVLSVLVLCVAWGFESGLVLEILKPAAG